MAAQTGRTVQDFTNLLFGVAAGTMTSIPVDEIGDIGLDYPEEEVSAFVDAIKGALVGKPGFELDFGGPFSNIATTGPHVLLSTWLAGQNLLSFDVQIGIRHAWEAGEPQFGVTGVIASNSGCTITRYKVSGNRFTARIRMVSGSVAAPAWGTAAEAIPS